MADFGSGGSPPRPVAQTGWADRRCGRRSVVALIAAAGVTRAGSFGRAAAQEDQGSWQRRAAMPLAKTDFGSSVVDGLIYTFGGMTGARGTALDDATVYDPKADEWRSLPPLPTPRRSVRAGAIGSTIYVVGGVSEAGTTGAMDVFDVAAETWSSSPSMPTARFGVGLAVVLGSLYAIGGFRDGQAVATVERYDPVAARWHTLSPMPTPRTHLVALPLDGTIHAFGGEADEGAMPVVERYDVAADRWRPGPELPLPMSNYGGALFEQRAHLLYHREHLVFDASSDTWSTAEPMPTPRHGQGMAVVDGTLYAVGGCHQQLFDLDITEAYRRPAG